MRRKIDQCAGQRILNNLLQAGIYHARSDAISEAIFEVWQDVSRRPRCRGSRHRIRQTPEQIPPCKNFADLRLDASELLGPRRVNALEQQPGDEIQFHCKSHTAMEHETGQEAGSREKIVYFLDVA